MSTRSLIGLVKGNKVEFIYCHNDGYVEYNGVMLKIYYQSEDKVQALIDMCDISSLGANVVSNEEWAKMTPEEHSRLGEHGTRYYTMSYNNWRNEGTTKHECTLAQYLGNDIMEGWGVDYAYHFVNGEWHCRNWRGEEKAIPNMEDLEDA